MIRAHQPPAVWGSVSWCAGGSGDERCTVYHLLQFAGWPGCVGSDGAVGVGVGVVVVLVVVVVVVVGVSSVCSGVLMQYW